MLRRLLCLCLVLAAALCASAVAVDRARRAARRAARADLDGDGTNETVRAREPACYGRDGQFPPPCPKVVLRSLFVEVADDCEGGEHAFALSREMDFMTLARIVDADRDGARARARLRGPRRRDRARRAGEGRRLPRRGRRLRRRAQDAVLLSAAGDDRAPAARRRVRQRRARDRRFQPPPARPRAAHDRRRTRDPRTPAAARATAASRYWRYDVRRHAYLAYRTKLTRLPRAT